jgi:hypothetical protein
MLSGIGQGNNLALPSSSAARPAMVGASTMDVTENDGVWQCATATKTHVLSRITTRDVRLLGCIAIGYAPLAILLNFLPGARCGTVSLRGRRQACAERRDSVLALIALYKSLGGGWRTASADASINVTRPK